MKQTIKPINIVIAGGSGFWAETNHYPAILELKKEKFPVRITAIIDLVDPYTTKNRPNIHKLLEIDKPVWIDPSKANQNQIKESLNKLQKDNLIDLLIIATNPVSHYFYSKWGLKNEVHVICDKPLVANIDASSNLLAAKEIQKQYEELESLYFAIKKQNPNYLFGTPLRRRALTPFVKIAEDFKEVYKKTGEGINYMSVILNSGLHRYPVEFLKAGAHGYLEGIGSLSHSSYHYIDMMAWYLQLARGDVAKVKVSLPYVLRVKDYIQTGKYKNLKEIIEGKENEIDDNITLPDNVLNSEIDFTFHMQLFNKHDLPVGLFTFAVNHSTYTPRLVKYNKDVIDHANEKGGGRMSQVYMDIHQGALQNWQLIKNDVVFSEDCITITGRKHPELGPIYQREEYQQAYNVGTNPRDLLKAFIKSAAGVAVDKKYIDLVSTFETQKLTNRIFSAVYEKIAEDHENKTKKVSKIIDSTITLDNYL